MYDTILIPLDGSTFAESALEHVRAIGKGCRAKKVILFRVVEPIVVDVKDYVTAEHARAAEEKREADARQYLEKIAADLKKEGLSVETRQKINGEPAEGILETAREEKVDLIIMSTHGRTGFQKWIFGSVAHRVLIYSPVPVLMVAPRGMERAKR